MGPFEKRYEATQAEIDKLLKDAGLQDGDPERLIKAGLKNTIGGERRSGKTDDARER